MRRLQNKVAESTLTLPIVVALGVLVWLFCGLIKNGWWIQLACFAASCYLMVELSNSNALLRIRSRMVTSTFIVLSCAASPLFGSLQGGITQLCFIIALLMFFQTYQQPERVGRIYYGYLFISLASLLFPQVLCFVPFLWILQATQLQAFSAKVFFASLLGLVTPYWLWTLWCVFTLDFSSIADHLLQLWQLETPFQHFPTTVGLISVFSFTMIVGIAGIVHFWLRSFEDKIRIRLLYGYFTSLVLLCAFFILLQPQHFEVLIRLLTVFASPLIAHFLTLTQSRITNIAFIVISVLALALIVLNLWMPSLSF